MKKYFCSYTFDAKGVTGNGDYSFECGGISSMNDIVELKKLIQEYLIENGYVNPTVVITFWRPFEEKSA